MLNEGGVGTNWRLYFSTNKIRYLRNRARCDKGYYWSLIGNRVRAFDWYQNQRPWLTQKWPWTAIMHSVALHTRVSDPTTKICMKTDPYYQRQKCSPGILVSSKVSFMRIFIGFRWRGGVKWECGGRKWRFSLLSLAISSEPSCSRPQLLYCTMWPLSCSSLTPKRMTLNDLEWSFCVKIWSELIIQWAGVLAFGENCSEICRAMHIGLLSAA